MFKVKYHATLLILLMIGLLLPLQISFAADEEGGAEKEAEYYELTPPFVVNLMDSGSKIRFLQTRIQVLAYGKENIDLVKKHDAPIRDALISLLASKKRSDIKTSKMKKMLQKDALKTVQEVLLDETGKNTWWKDSISQPLSSSKTFNF